MYFFPEATPSDKTLGPSLVDAFAEFWMGGEGPNHTLIDRKIAAAGIVPTQGVSKERKVVDAFMDANDEQADILMRGLLEGLRQYSAGRFSQGPLGTLQAGIRLRKAIEAAGYVLNDDFEIEDDQKEPMPAHLSQTGGRQAPQTASASPQIPAAEPLVTVAEKTAILESKTDKTPPQEIFLVHGHDEAAMLRVSDWVHDLTGVKPIILSKQINRGQTLIEKFESYSKDAACAIVLMTPDDDASAKRSPSDVEERARQNVVFELGYFYGKLKRENVIVLNFGVELPGDIRGLVYIGEDGWKLDLGKELAALGFRAHL